MEEVGNRILEKRRHVNLPQGAVLLRAGPVQLLDVGTLEFDMNYGRPL